MIVNSYKISFFKLIFALLMGHCAHNNKIVAMQNASKSKEVIIFDLDDTLIKVDLWNAYRAILWEALPWNVFTLLGLKSNRLPDKYGNKRFRGTSPEDLAPGGGATSLGFYGLYGNNAQDFQQLVPKILDITWKNAMFIPGAKTLLNYLQQQGYPIIYATNKDYTSYVHVAKTMDEKYNGDFSKYPKLVLVTHPRQETLNKWSNEVKEKKTTIPENFRALIKEIAEGKENPSKHIYFADGYEKPVDGYYEILKKRMSEHVFNGQIPENQRFVFFDDKQINITSAKKNEIDGYTVKNVADIVAGLQKESIINPEKDPLLYAQLEKEGVFGFIKQITRYTKNPGYQKRQTAQ